MKQHRSANCILVLTTATPWAPRQTVRMSKEVEMISPCGSPPDKVLIEMAVAGRSDCFSVLVDRHLPAVRRHLRAMVPNEPDQEDILQEVLLKVWRHLADFRLECNLRTWMIKIAINEVRQWYRRRTSRQVFQPLDDSGAIASMEDSPEKRLLRNEAGRAVQRGLAALPAKYRDVLVLRYIEETTGEDTATFLGMTVPAMKTRTFRARRLLATKLRQWNLAA
jgi:RNA polymerase sigma-70 factor (ECF subfamily)